MTIPSIIEAFRFDGRLLRVSKQLSADLRDEAARAAAAFGDAADVVDEAAAATFGVNRTDLRILGLVHTAGAMSATALAGAAKLSPAATTTAIHRLGAAGYLTRTVDDSDRRRAVVALTPDAEKLLDRVYGPVERAGHRILAAYSPEELALITGFLRRGIDMQLAEADRIRTMTA
jgi:DNA-binding MarR family transcriptional regulator